MRVAFMESWRMLLDAVKTFSEPRPRALHYRAHVHSGLAMGCNPWPNPGQNRGSSSAAGTSSFARSLRDAHLTAERQGGKAPLCEFINLAIQYKTTN